MLTYDMSQRGDESLYVHLYRCIRHDIEQGTIRPGQRLPSKRGLAQHLGVSVVTVEGAYRQLVAEGYVHGRARRGYYAADLGRTAANASHPGISAGYTAVADYTAMHAEAAPAAHAASQPPAPAVLPLEAEGSFPYAAWAKSLREALSMSSHDQLVRESDGMGSPMLRRVLADYLRQFRGMRVDPACIVVGAGAQTLYNLLVQLLGRDRMFAVEDPGYPRLARIYRANDVRLVPVPLDHQGVSVEYLRRTQASVLHFMPSHQYPTGLVTPASRRYQLLGWAAEEPGRYLVEDDFDCEFRMEGGPMPALQSMDASECVIYANTFTKTLGQAFRIGYMVLPPHLAQAYKCNLGFYSCTVSAIDQLALAQFIRTGHYERHVSRARTKLGKAQDTLLNALGSGRLAGHVQVEGAKAGLHLVLALDDARPEEELAGLARQAGAAVAPMEAFRFSGGTAEAAGPAAAVAAGEGGTLYADGLRRFVVSMANMEPEDAAALAANLQRAWR